VNQSKFSSIYNGLSSVAKKVYDAVPQIESRNVHSISSELARTGKAMDIKVFQGCLSHLVQIGLVQENNGTFTRKPVRISIKSPVEVEVVTKEDPKALDNIDQLASLAKRAADLGNMLKILSSDIETAALAIEEQNQANAKENEKIQQLVKLLKSLG
jgi:hypothetical protein